MSKTALFVVDTQKELVADPASRIPHAERVQHAGTQLLAAARILKTPSYEPLIIFVQHEDAPGKGSLQKGSEPWELVFQPNNVMNERLVAKSTRDTFESNPDLAQSLKDEGVTHIVVFGVQSECCVQETSKGALDAGFKVTLLHGAHSTYDNANETAADIESEVESLLKSRGAKVVDWQSAAENWKSSGVLC